MSEYHLDPTLPRLTPGQCPECGASSASWIDLANQLSLSRLARLAAQGRAEDAEAALRAYRAGEADQKLAAALVMSFCDKIERDIGGTRFAQSLVDGISKLALAASVPLPRNPLSRSQAIELAGRFFGSSVWPPERGAVFERAYPWVIDAIIEASK